ncbi:MAG: CotH kinase family protein [Kofleriaceae bacterium]|nr:CotH kinase family protein [Kofleriaceae bacterium]
MRAVAIAMVGIACAAQPDYATVFPQGVVVEAKLHITPARWKTMTDDLRSLMARIPPLPGFPPGPPPEGILGRFPPGPPPDEMLVLHERNPIYVEADLALGGTRARRIGVRFKGNSTLMRSYEPGSARMPYRIEIDKFVEQRLLGFESISLANNLGDRSLLRARVANETFAAFGIPTAASATFHVVLDRGAGDEDLGLYTASELPDDEAFLRRELATADGVLYKPEGRGARWHTFDASSLGAKGEKPDMKPARALFDALHADRTDAAAWRARLERAFDVERFLRWLVIDTLISEWDSYGRMAHNYYLFAPRGGRLTWIHWDHNEAFGNGPPFVGTRSIGQETITDDWPLIRKLLDDPVYAQRYRVLVAEALDTVASLAMIEARFRRGMAVITPALGPLDPPRAEVERAVTEILAGHAKRIDAARSWLAKQVETRPQQR